MHVTCEQNAKLAALNSIGVEEIVPKTMNVNAMISAQSMVAVEQAGSAPGATFLQARIGNDAALITKNNLKDQRKTRLAELAKMTSKNNVLNVVFLCMNL